MTTAPNRMNRKGPLAGVTVVEMAAIGPGPFCGMMLADMGARVIRVDRAPLPADRTPPPDPMLRSRDSVAVNLKAEGGAETVLRLIEKADILLEGFRPGVMERLGLGPEVCHARNPALVFGRMTGWGQDGPQAQLAGHDINYIAITGALHAIGRTGQKPVPPLNLLGDFGGGGMLLAFGLMCALHEAAKTGKGQVVDAAIVDGTAAVMASSIAFLAQGMFNDQAVGDHMLSGATHFYDTYETSDGKYVSIGSIEPQFYQILIDRAGLDPDAFGPYGWRGVKSLENRDKWPALKEKLTEVIKSKTRDQWCEIFDGTDACFAPVLTMTEAFNHPHNVARSTFIDVNGQMQNAPAPRFSRTETGNPTPPRSPGQDTDQVLGEFGFTRGEINNLRAAGIIG